MFNNRIQIPLILSLLLLFVVVSVLYTNNLSRQFAQEEQERMELWANATQKLIKAEPDEDIDFYTTIIERNTTIPVYMLDSAGNVLYMRNVKKPVKDPTTLYGPIEIRFKDFDGTQVLQYIYYDQSMLLTQLRYVPYAQFAVIIIFVLLAVFSIITTQRNEQNRVWVGLSKETAHQLGTPISSLNAWQDLLEAKYKDDDLIPQMRLDIVRLQTIADRFSKVGSEPDLTPMPIIPVIKDAMSYMRTRVSNKVNINFSVGQLNHITSKPVADDSIIVMLNKPLFETKQRGWGLGLSLAKRIIEDYHRGKLFLKASQMGKGSTFRIILEKAVDC